jgi:hypothetical protein
MVQLIALMTVVVIRLSVPLTGSLVEVGLLLLISAWLHDLLLVAAEKCTYHIFNKI